MGLTLAQRLLQPVISFAVHRFFPKSAFFGAGHFRAVESDVALKEKWKSVEMACAMIVVTYARKQGAPVGHLRGDERDRPGRGRRIVAADCREGRGFGRPANAPLTGDSLPRTVLIIGRGLGLVRPSVLSIGVGSLGILPMPSFISLSEPVRFATVQGKPRARTAGFSR